MLVFCYCYVHKRGPLASASLYNKYSASLQDKVVMPRMQWIHQKREQMADALGLPDVDVAALEATGRSHVPSMKVTPIPAPTPLPMQSQPSEPVQELNKPER